MFEKAFRHASMGELVFFIFRHPGRHCSVLWGDRDASLDGLNEFSYLLIRSFVAEAYCLSEVLLPVEFDGATEGLEVSFKGSVIFRTGLL